MLDQVALATGSVIKTNALNLSLLVCELAELDYKVEEFQDNVIIQYA